MIAQDKIKEAKAVLISDYLASRNIFPSHNIGKELVYKSPFNCEEKSPSFFVKQDANIYKCFSTGNGGDIFHLVSTLERLNFPDTVNRLLTVSKSEIVYELPTEKVKDDFNNKTFIHRFSEIKSPALINYFCKERRIDLKVLKKYCKQVYYYNEKGKFYAVGFPNSKAGIELRSKHFKGCIGQKYFSFYEGKDRYKLRIFEGFTDFLTYLTCNDLIKPINDCLVLNSTSLLNIDLINRFGKKYNSVYSYLDNDKAGKEAFVKLEKHLPKSATLFNISQLLYPNFKDLNEWHTNQEPKGNTTKID